MLSALSACAIAGALPAHAQAVPDPRPVPRFTRTHGIVHVSRVETGSPLVAMTFDDGPHPRHTPALLDILRARNIRATFYVIGRLVQRYPDIARRMVAEGHELGNHTWTHPFLSQLADTSVLRELDRTAEAIFAATGQVPVTLRPPYGAITARQSRMIHDSRNLPTVMWSVDPRDWQRPGSSVVANRIVGGAGNGAIILAHDIHGPTVAAMPAALDGLTERGFRFATMSALLGWGHWGPASAQPRLATLGERGDA